MVSLKFVFPIETPDEYRAMSKTIHFKNKRCGPETEHKVNYRIYNLKVGTIDTMESHWSQVM